MKRRAWIGNNYGLKPVHQGQEMAYVMSLIDTARSIALLAKKGRSVELLEELMKLRDEAKALHEENKKLKARVAELEGREGHHHFDGTVFWGPKDGKG